MKNNIKRITKKGYTLIEIIVGVSIFMIILAASSDFFVSSLEMQQKALISQRLLDNISYSLEYMSRSLRMAQKGSYDLTSTGIKFVNYQGQDQEFYLSPPDANGVSSIMVTTGGDPAESLTAQFLNVVSFKIYPVGLGIGGHGQPRITIFLEAQGVKSNKPELRPIIKAQTTISQRNLKN